MPTTIINKSSQVRERIVEWIRDGRYSPGQKLPSERAMAQEMAMSHLTVRRGLEGLVTEGLIVKQPRLGTFVAPEMVKLARKVIRVGLIVGSQMLEGAKQHPSLGAFLAGANQRCPAPKYIVQPIFFDTPFRDTVGPIVLNENLDGVIVLDGRLDNLDIQFLQDHRIPVVYQSHRLDQNEWVITLMYDRPEWLSQAVEHLRVRGHQRIALISYATNSDRGSLHRHFSQLAFEQRLGDPNELLVLIGSEEHVTHWQDVENFFRIKSLPTAVVVTDEFLADVVLDGCERRGIKVPDRLSLVALQDANPMGHRIPLTAVQTSEDMSRLAATACDLLIRRIEGQPIPESHVLISPKLVVKASTGPVKNV